MKSLLEKIKTSLSSFFKKEVSKIPDNVYFQAKLQIDKLDEERGNLKLEIRKRGEDAADTLVDFVKAKSLDLVVSMLQKIFKGWIPK